jgi:hypothetical protein
MLKKEISDVDQYFLELIMMFVSSAWGVPAWG